MFEQPQKSKWECIVPTLVGFFAVVGVLFVGLKFGLVSQEFVLGFFAPGFAFTSLLTELGVVTDWAGFDFFIWVILTAVFWRIVALCIVAISKKMKRRR